MIVDALLLIFPWAMAAAAIWDVFTLTIPNRISLALVAGFFIAAIATSMPLQTVAIHVACGIAVLALGFALFSFGWFGGGDAKLLAAAALWIGVEHLGVYVVHVAYAGGILAVVILMYRKLPLPHWLLGQPWALKLHDRTTGIPYGVAIASAAMILFPGTAWFATRI